MLTPVNLSEGRERISNSLPRNSTMSSRTLLKLLWLVIVIYVKDEKCYFLTYLSLTITAEKDPCVGLRSFQADEFDEVDEFDVPYMRSLLPPIYAFHGTTPFSISSKKNKEFFLQCSIEEGCSNVV